MAEPTGVRKCASLTAGTNVGTEKNSGRRGMREAPAAPFTLTDYGIVSRSSQLHKPRYRFVEGYP